MKDQHIAKLEEKRKGPTPLIRQMKVLLALINTRRGLTYDDIAHEVGVASSTAYRYLWAIQEAGASVLCEKVAGEYRYRVEGIKFRKKKRR